MPLPWLRLINGVIGATDIVRWVRGRAAGIDPQPEPGTLDQRLAGVVVGALREAFDRDSARLDIERHRLDDERMRGEKAMRLELLRLAGDRELGRLRLLSGIALASFLGSLYLVATATSGHAGASLARWLACLLLLLALAAAFSAQASVGRVLARGNDRSSPDDVTMTPGGIAAPWLIVAGLAAVALAMLLA